MTEKMTKKCGILPSSFFRSLVFFALVAVLVLPVYTFFYLTPAVQNFIIQSKEFQATRVALHMESKLISDKSVQLGKHILTEDVLKKIKGTSRDFNLWKVRIVFPDGEILFSSDSNEIGQTLDAELFHETVNKGTRFTQLRIKGEKSLQGQVMPADIVETYVPILRDNKTIGVFEIYYDITATRQKLNKLLWQFYTTLFPIALILIIAVVGSCRRANRNIAKRIEAEEKLVQQSDELKEKNEELTELIVVCRERQQRLESEQKARQEAQELVQQEMTKREQMRGDLLRHIVEAQEEERARIARELHDETAQTLTAASLNFATLKNLLDGKPEVSDLVGKLQNLCRQMNQDLYRLVHDLRPAQLDDLGLIPALRFLTDEGQQGSGLKVSLEISGKQQRLEPFVETIIFRIVQEALTNVTRHAETDHAAVKLSFEEQHVVLQVADQGKGFGTADPEDTRKGWGLVGIEERVKALKGQFRVESSPGQGTTLEAVVPLQVDFCQLQDINSLSVKAD